MITCILHLLQSEGMQTPSYGDSPGMLLQKQGFGALDSPQVKMNGNFTFHVTSLKIPFNNHIPVPAPQLCDKYFYAKYLCKRTSCHFPRTSTNIAFKGDDAIGAVTIL